MRRMPLCGVSMGSGPTGSWKCMQSVDRKGHRACRVAPSLGEIQVLRGTATCGGVFCMRV